MGIFPPPGENVKEAKEIAYYSEGHCNYESIDMDPAADDEVHKLIGMGGGRRLRLAQGHLGSFAGGARPEQAQDGNEGAA